MEVFKLNGSYLPSDTIGKFETMIWTERYAPAGDFKIVVEDDISILSRLPEGSLISHTDTLEVMIVENHEIERNKEKKLIVTVSGRSVETFSEERTTVGSDTQLYTAGVANVESLGSTPSCHAAAYILKYKLEPGTAPANDAVTNFRIVEEVTTHDIAMTHTVKRGSVYAQVLEFLNLSNTGLRTRRPNGVQTTLDIVVHDGTDLTDTVVFYAQNEDLTNARYFRSIKGYKNYAQIAAHDAALLYRTRDLGSDVTGLDRRVIYEDANDIEGAIGTVTAKLQSRGQQAIDDNKRTSIISASISETARPKFKLDYEVGDLVMVYGEFGAAEVMRVTEHILTVDKNGIKGYPSLRAE
jgi:Siphovirus ReqiPepy6 Gp37-like protein